MLHPILSAMHYPHPASAAFSPQLALARFLSVAKLALGPGHCQSRGRALSFPSVLTWLLAAGDKRAAALQSSITERNASSSEAACSSLSHLRPDYSLGEQQGDFTDPRHME